MSPLELELVRKTSITTVVVVENISQLRFLLLENHLPLFAQTVSVLTAQFKVQKIGCSLTCHLRLRLSKSESKVLASDHETLRTLHD